MIHPVGQRSADGCPECIAYLRGEKGATAMSDYDNSVAVDESGRMPRTAGRPAPLAGESDTFTFARQETLQDISTNVNRLRVSMTTRREPLGMLRTIVAVAIGGTLAGIMLAALAFFAVATFLASAVDDVQGEIQNETQGETFGDTLTDESLAWPTDVPTDLPTTDVVP